jgi:hypothetical protein
MRDQILAREPQISLRNLRKRDCRDPGSTPYIQQGGLAATRSSSTPAAGPLRRMEVAMTHRKLLFIGILAALAVLSPLKPALSQSATGPPHCVDRKAVVHVLRSGFGETLAARGLSNGGVLVELFLSPGRTWTLLATLPNTRSCLIAEGIAWETVRFEAAVPSRAEPPVTRQAQAVKGFAVAE